MAVLHLFNTTPASGFDLLTHFGSNPFHHYPLASPQQWLLIITAPLPQNNLLFNRIKLT